MITVQMTQEAYQIFIQTIAARIASDIQIAEWWTGETGEEIEARYQYAASPTEEF